jgi:uncharacterized membrane protein HdeD (DUF308 family)
MSDQPSPDMEDFRRRIAEALKLHWRAFLIQGIVMMVLGLVAIALPHLSTIAIELFLGWLILFGGVFRTLTLLRSKSAPGFFWSLVTALLVVVLGIVLLLRPAEGVLTFTMILIALFIVEGVTAIIISLQLREHLKTWAWTLLSGIVDLVLAFFIWQGWPSTAGWALGLLVGINMFFLGNSLTMTALVARKEARGDHSSGS